MFPGQLIDIRLKVLLMISVLVIDDHPIALQGCRRVLEDAGIAPIFCTTDLEAAYQLLLTHRPDVAIVDLAFPGDSLGGLRFIRRIKASAKQTHVLVFSMHDDPAIVGQALEAGASQLRSQGCAFRGTNQSGVSGFDKPAHLFARMMRCGQHCSNQEPHAYFTANAVQQGSDTFAPYVHRQQSLRPVLSFSEGAR
jgi:CheY-like chemotaxis protein